MKFNFEKHLELIPRPEKYLFWDRVKIEKQDLKADLFNRMYPSAKLEYVDPAEIPVQIKNQLIWRILRDSLDWSSPKPATLFKIIFDDGSVNYCAKYFDEICEDKFEGDEIEKKIKYSQDKITFFEFGSHGDQMGYGAIKLVGKMDTDGSAAPIPDIVSTESEYLRMGIGGERYFLMNALSKTFFNKPLFSSPSMVDEPIAFWKKLTELGGAKQIYFPEEGSLHLPGFMFTTNIPTWKEFKEKFGSSKDHE